MKPIFVTPKEFDQELRRVGRRTDEELMILRQSVISGAYVVHPTEVADAMLAVAWFEDMTHGPRH